MQGWSGHDFSTNSTILLKNENFSITFDSSSSQAPYKPWIIFIFLTQKIKFISSKLGWYFIIQINARFNARYSISTLLQRNYESEIQRYLPFRSIILDLS